MKKKADKISVRPSPFLKWAGGKNKLIKQYSPFFPKKFQKYFEPFLGGGAVFFHLSPKNAYLSDSNEELINCYLQIKDNPEELMGLLAIHKMNHNDSDKEYYYKIRGMDPDRLNSIKRAARLIYLNKTCYNGLYRVNSQGLFNVPFGRYKNPGIYNPENILAASRMLKSIEIETTDFMDIAEKTGKGDLVYFDPPYHPLSITSSFTDYTSRFSYFGDDAQRELSGLFKHLHKEGCFVMLSNSDTPLVRNLYDDFYMHPIMAPRFINSKAEGRKAIRELLICNFNEDRLMEKKRIQKKAVQGRVSKYYKPWEKIIKARFNSSEPINIITATEIKEITGEEPRLMTKFDSRRNLPPVLRNRNLFILPVANGKYALAPGDGYHDIEKIQTKSVNFISRIPFPLNSADYGSSEMQFIDYAYNSGLISRFTGVDRLFPTIRGRKYSPRFSFRLGDIQFPEVSSVQVEVDAGYEGEDEIILIEAKVGRIGSFHIRQLFYPFRFWKQAVSHKKIRSIFFQYDTDSKIYKLFEYEFPDPYNFFSIRLKQAGKFRITTKDFAKEQREILFQKSEEPEKTQQDWAIPQADDMEKIISIPFLIDNGINTAKKIAGALEFTLRQSSYYRKAAQDLDFLKKGKGKFFLTDIGKKFIKMPVEKRNRFLSRQMLKLPIMKEIMANLYEKKCLRIKDIAQIIEENSNLHGTTTRRRARTIRAWFCWLYSALGIVKVGRDSIFIS